MDYKAELRLLRATYGKCRVLTQLLDGDTLPESKLAQIIGRQYQQRFTDTVSTPAQRTVYRLTDPLHCRYIYLRLPDTSAPAILLIGPYLSEEVTHQQLLEFAEHIGITPQQTAMLERYYTDIPLLAEESQLLALLEAFCESLWRGSDYTVVDLDQKSENFLSLVAEQTDSEADSAAFEREIIEARYAYENEVMQAVSQGQIHKADRLLSAFSSLPFEKRLADPVRNLKNYCIIMNTLLRKAAENGGVHPLYLDSMSSDFAKKIEQLSNTEVVYALMSDMFRSYCRLVRKHSLTAYSPPVQKAILCIDSDLSANLNLRTLAAMQDISAGYLSTLFKKETGMTITEHINRKRVQKAIRLLETTRLQIQTIAQHCGILDVQYFSKVFKKQTGMTPKEYRENPHK